MSGQVRRVHPDDWRATKSVRLAALAESPIAFATTLAEAAGFDDSVWITRAAEASEGLSQATFLLDDAGSIRGTVTGLTDRDNTALCWLVAMWIEPGARRRGHAQQLTEALIEWATDAGFEAMRLWVTVTNEPAKRLYESVGFADTGTVTALPSHPEVMEALYELRLGEHA